MWVKIRITVSASIHTLSHFFRRIVANLQPRRTLACCLIIAILLDLRDLVHRNSLEPLLRSKMIGL